MSDRMSGATTERSRPVRRRLLAIGALVGVAATVGFGFRTMSATPAPVLAPTITWRPEAPSQGRLFVVSVQDTAGATLAGVRGSVAGETLHFHEEAPGVFESLAPASVEAPEQLGVSVTLVYADGREAERSVAVPVAPGAFEHERLTVAPRFGSPLDSADQARLARDQARANRVSEAAHATPRIWTLDLVIPRDDRVTSGFGNGREFNGQVTSRHTGLDLDGETGDTVYAVGRGVVELVDEFLLAGNIVYLNHGAGLVSGYFHLSEQLVTEGDTVTTGTPIGRVGATGRVTGPHLHWVVRYGHTSVDPRSLLEVASGSGEGS